MALYQNGILISGANALPQMTLAEYQALPVSERPTYWERTDLNYGNIPADNVTYGQGTVEDALDDINDDLVHISTVTCTGTTDTSGSLVPTPTLPLDYVILDTYSTGNLGYVITPRYVPATSEWRFRVTDYAGSAVQDTSISFAVRYISIVP